VCREPGAAIGRETTGRDEVVDVRVVRQVTSPGMQNADQTELSTHKTRVVCQKPGCLCRSTEEQVIDQRLVTTSDWAQGCRQGESEHEVRDGQQKLLLFLQPFLGLIVLALGAVTVAARVVAVLGLVALRAGIGLSTQSGGSALLNGAHGPSMAGKQVLGIFLAIGGTILAKDVRQF
jgi:hypothetical protein